MVETRWPELGSKELRYRDHTWELTGDVDVRRDGALLAVRARQVDDVRGRPATLYFGLDDPPDSLNPGALGDHFDSLERTSDGQYLLVKKEGRSYRYELRRIEYD